MKDDIFFCNDMQGLLFFETCLCKLCSLFFTSLGQLFFSEGY